MAAVLAGPVARQLEFNQVKRPLPLRKPFDELDPQSLYPYRVVQKQVLDSEVVDALGTSQYLIWLLEDQSVPQRDPLRFANLFVTYYSGGSSLVPHVPDVCYLGVGYDPAQPHENQDLSIRTLSPPWNPIPVRVCTFAKTAVFQRDEISVVYTFSVNGRFAATQHRVRVAVHDLTTTYAYFSKVEVSFPQATRQQSVEGAQKVFERVLPLLIQNHWPEFERAEQEARQVTTGS